VVVAIKALACELPARLGVPLSRLHVMDLRAEAISRGIVADIGDTTIWRWLSADAIKPWRVRGWIFPRDPRLRGQGWPRAEPVRPHPERRAPARRRLRRQRRREDLHPGPLPLPPTLPPAAARHMRVEREYDRGGALAT